MSKVSYGCAPATIVVGNMDYVALKESKAQPGSDFKDSYGSRSH